MNTVIIVVASILVLALLYFFVIKRRKKVIKISVGDKTPSTQEWEQLLADIETALAGDDPVDVIIKYFQKRINKYEHIRAFQIRLNALITEEGEKELKDLEIGLMGAKTQKECVKVVEDFDVVLYPFQKNPAFVDKYNAVLKKYDL
jgi:hypothetical protein